MPSKLIDVLSFKISSISTFIGMVRSEFKKKNFNFSPTQIETHKQMNVLKPFFLLASMRSKLEKHMYVFSLIIDGNLVPINPSHPFRAC